MIKYLFLSMILFIGVSSFAQANETCRANKSLEIIKVFDKGIILNEKFKKTVGGSDKEEYKRQRKGIEKYNEETVMPCVRRAAQLLSQHSNPVLMRKLMELVISYENSGDETVSYAMGKIFSANPASVERTIKEFPSDRRKLIFNSVQTGWVNVKPELSPALGKNRDEQLRQLLLSVDRR